MPAVMNTLKGCVIIGAFALLSRNFGLFVLASLICTAGISLVIWLPLAWAVGSIATLLVQAILPSGLNPAAASQTTSKPSIIPDPTRDRALAVQDFVDKAVASGLGRKEVAELMIKNGWSKQDTEQVVM